MLNAVCAECVDFVARPTSYVANAERCVCRVCASRVTHRASPVAGRPPVTASSVHLAMSDRGSLQRATKPCCGTCWTRRWWNTWPGPSSSALAPSSSSPWLSPSCRPVSADVCAGRPSTTMCPTGPRGPTMGCPPWMSQTLTPLPPAWQWGKREGCPESRTWPTPLSSRLIPPPPLSLPL